MTQHGMHHDAVRRMLQEIAADAAAPPAKAAETSKPEEEEVPTQEQDGVLESLPPAEVCALASCYVAEK